MMFGFFKSKAKKLGDAESQLLALMKDNISLENEKKALMERQIEQVKVGLDRAKNEQAGRKREEARVKKSAACAHLKIIATYMERSLTPGQSSARIAELAAIIAVRKARAEELGFVISSDLDSVLKQIESLQSGD